jgi:Concanavalin A-like lectin/glucanases superfamily
MSLSFDGLTNLVARSANATLGSVISVSAWVKPISYGESTAGAVWQHGSQSDIARLALRVAGASFGQTNGFGFGSGRATTNGRWASPDSIMALNVWQHLAATYDGALTANNAQLYRNGAPVTTTRSVAPVGAIIADTQVIYVGNNGAIAARTFDGAIGEVAAWTRILSAAEIAAVYMLGASAVPDYFDYLPFDSGRIQCFGTGASVYAITGAVAGENPPVRPAGRRG